MLYLETPVGVGFSYSIDTKGYDAVSDAVTGIFLCKKLYYVILIMRK